MEKNATNNTTWRLLRCSSRPCPPTPLAPVQIREAGLNPTFYVGNKNLTFLGEFMFDYKVHCELTSCSSGLPCSFRALTIPHPTRRLLQEHAFDEWAAYYGDDEYDDSYDG